jgi:hypothetical protein
LALVEEQKAETELEMKREIKYLLEQWIVAKNSAASLMQQAQRVNESRYTTTSHPSSQYVAYN